MFGKNLTILPHSKRDTLIINECFDQLLKYPRGEKYIFFCSQTTRSAETIAPSPPPTHRHLKKVVTSNYSTYLLQSKNFAS